LPVPYWDFRRSINSVQVLVSLGEECGLTPAQLLNHTGLSVEQLRDPHTEVEAGQELQLVRNLLRGCPGRGDLGVRAGLRYHISSYGLWGFAMMSSPSLRAAVQLGLRLVSLSFVFVRLQLLEGADSVELRVDGDEIPEGERQFLLERDLVAAMQLLNELCASPIPLLSVSFSCARPEHAGWLQEIFACPVHFDAASTGMRVSSAVLDLPLPQANAVTVQACEQLCQNLLEQRRQRSGLAARIRQRLLRSDDAFPGLEQIAGELGMTSRSLRRHLAGEGTRFRGLLDECRELLAEQLLVQLRLPVEDVAARLGYAEASSFIIAFRRWKGMTPHKFARQALR
jgi:AraC-like DNA-binding protein